MDIFRELKAQYTKEEWLEKREEIFTKISRYDHSGWMSEFYKEEQLYDRLLDLVLESPKIYMLKSYANILKEDYPEQILQKYAKEVQQMAAYAADRSKLPVLFTEMVGTLCTAHFWWFYKRILRKS